MKFRPSSKRQRPPADTITKLCILRFRGIVQRRGVARTDATRHSRAFRYIVHDRVNHMKANYFCRNLRLCRAPHLNIRASPQAWLQTQKSQVALTKRKPQSSQPIGTNDGFGESAHQAQYESYTATLADISAGATSDAHSLFSTLSEIWTVEQMSRTAVERVLPDGMKLPHYKVLGHFEPDLPEASPAQLADLFQVTRATMTNTLQRLEKKGLIDTRPDPSDGRAKIVTITPQGRAAYAKATAALEPFTERMAAALPMGELRRMLPVLQTIRQWLDDDRQQVGCR